MGRAVEEASKAHAEDEDIAAEAPEEFLDPIMSHLMTDPVILPSSKVGVQQALAAPSGAVLCVPWGDKQHTLPCEY